MLPQDTYQQPYIFYQTSKQIKNKSWQVEMGNQVTWLWQDSRRWKYKKGSLKKTVKKRHSSPCPSLPGSHWGGGIHRASPSCAFGWRSAIVAHEDITLKKCCVCRIGMIFLETMDWRESRIPLSGSSMEDQEILSQKRRTQQYLNCCRCLDRTLSQLMPYSFFKLCQAAWLTCVLHFLF